MSSPGHPSSTSFFQKAASCAVGSAIIWRTNLVGQLSDRKGLAAWRSISCSSENPKSNLRASVLSMGILRLKPLRSMFQVPLRLSSVQAPGMLPHRGSQLDSLAGTATMVTGSLKKMDHKDLV